MDIFLEIFKSPGPELLKIGPVILRWYGLLIGIAVLLGLNISNYLAKKRNLDKDLINDLLPILLLSSIIGARAYYVLFEWRQYKFNIFEIFAIWNGGIAIHGAIISGSFAIYLFCKFRNKPFLEVIDVIVPSLAIGQSIGRWGNFFNNEAFGIPTTLPWKIFIPYIYRPLEFKDSDFFHPTFLYESLWNIFVFVILISLFVMIKNKLVYLKTGSIGFSYLILYSVGRLFIEGIRIDPLCIGGIAPFCEGGVRLAQIISILLIILGSIGLIRVNTFRNNLKALK